jgi:hypothetical protein
MIGAGSVVFVKNLIRQMVDELVTYHGDGMPRGLPPSDLHAA